MSIGANQHVVLILAFSTGIIAQIDESSIKSQNHAVVPDVRQIVESSIAATQRHWRTRLQYTYVERDEDRRLDSEGRVKSKEVNVSRTIFGPRMTEKRWICSRCGWNETRPSLRQGFTDGLLAVFLISPFRCRKCRNRFYRFSCPWLKHLSDRFARFRH